MPDSDTKVPEWPLPRTNPMLPPADYVEFREGPPRIIQLAVGGTAWLITRHADACVALKDARLSSDENKPGFRDLIQVPMAPRSRSFWRMDEPEHGRLRRMIAPEFTAHNVRAKRQVIIELIDELLDEIAVAPQPVDLVASFALPIPSLVIARLLGVPESDYRTFAKMSQDILSLASPEETYGAFLAMTGYLDKLAYATEGDPGDDIMGRLASRYVANGQLTHDDFLSMVRFFLVAGHETTANQIALSMLTVLQHPEQRAELLRQPDLIHPFIEEALRYWSVSQDNVTRVAAEDLDIGGIRISRGEAVVIAIPAANHDERMFPDAARFDIHRDARQHLAFGVGPHRCPGASLAHLEIELAIPALFTRFPDLHLAIDTADLRFRKGTIIYGLEALPATLTW
jgi:cytochrome P450